MAEYGAEKKIEIPEILPLLPIRDIVVFPLMVVPLSVGRQKSIKALDEAMATSTKPARWRKYSNC